MALTTARPESTECHRVSRPWAGSGRSRLPGGPRGRDGERREASHQPLLHLRSPMASVGTRTSPAPWRLEQLSTRLVFFVAGFGMAAWAPLVPFAKARIGID